MFKLFFLLLTLFLSLDLLAADNLTQVLERYQIPLETIDEKILELPVLTASVENITEKEQIIKLYIQNSTDIYVVWKNEYEFDIEKSKKSYQLIIKNFEGKVKGTLFDSVLADLKDESIARVISEAFKEEFVSTKGLRVDATYSMSLEEIYEDDEFNSFGRVLSAKMVVGKAIVEKVLMRDLEKKTLVLTNVIPNEGERVFVSPIGTSVVSSVFNLTRKHPVKKRIQPHNGIDFKAKSGTSVFPAFEGEIIGIGRARAKGKFVRIRHANGIETTYDHLRKFQKGLRVGMYVDTRDQIGEVGRTGLATGAHLHFGMLKNDQYVNPLYYLKDYQIANEKDFELEELESER